VSCIKASDAAKALSTIANKLLEGDIVQPEGFAVLQRIAYDVARGKDAESWRIEIDRGEKLLFSKTTDKNGKPITPSIVAAGICVDQSRKNTPPFSALDIAIEIDDAQNAPVARWHLDLANEQNGTVQSGPLFHLQFGGHQHGYRHLDHPLKVPRWCHPPMEVALLCEVVAANFFTEHWVEIREDPNWCQSISLYQKLCYSSYLEKLSACLSVSSSTALNAMWAANWN
jgi:hypothetical protein